MLLNHVIAAVAAVVGLFYAQVHLVEIQHYTVPAFAFVQEMETRGLAAVSSRLDQCMEEGFCAIVVARSQYAIEAVRSSLSTLPEFDFYKVQPIIISATKTRFIAFESATPTRVIDTFHTDASVSWMMVVAFILVTSIIGGIICTSHAYGHDEMHHAESKGSAFLYEAYVASLHLDDMAPSPMDNDSSAIMDLTADDHDHFDCDSNSDDIDLSLSSIVGSIYPVATANATITASATVTATGPSSAVTPAAINNAVTPALLVIASDAAAVTPIVVNQPTVTTHTATDDDTDSDMASSSLISPLDSGFALSGASTQTEISEDSEVNKDSDGTAVGGSKVEAELREDVARLRRMVDLLQQERRDFNIRIAQLERTRRDHTAL